MTESIMMTDDSAKYVEKMEEMEENEFTYQHMD
jgi:hypothetical protein